MKKTPKLGAHPRWCNNGSAPRGIRDVGARNLVRKNESALYQGFVIQREVMYNLPVRIQRTGLLVRNSGKFVITGVDSTADHSIELMN